MIGVECYSRVYLCTYVNDYIRMSKKLCIHIVTCIFVIEVLRVLLDLKKRNLNIGEFSRVCCKCTWFLVFNESAPMGIYYVS